MKTLDIFESAEFEKKETQQEAKSQSKSLVEQVQEAMAEDTGVSGGGGTLVPPPPNEVQMKSGGCLGSGFLFLIAVFLIGRTLLRMYFSKGKNVLVEEKVDVLKDEHPQVREAIEKLYASYPKACRHCHASATEPSFQRTSQGEEECSMCYARGRDPYDVTKKMERRGEYLISPTFNLDPLYRGGPLPGHKILSLREELEDSCSDL